MAQPGAGPGQDLPVPGTGDVCPHCGDQMRAHPTRRGLNYGLRPGREVLEQTCVGCGLLRVRVLPARGIPARGIPARGIEE